MIRKNAPEGTDVYHERWGLFGKIVNNPSKSYKEMIDVEFPDFNAMCYPKSLIEIENLISEKECIHDAQRKSTTPD